jgi:serralysin
MRSHLASNPQDLGDGDMNFVPTVFGPSAGLGGGTPIGSTPPTPPQPVAPVLPDESVQAMAAVSGSGTGGTGSVVAETSSSGFTINLVFDSAAMAAPASFRAGIEQAAAILSETITNKITVNLDIDYSGTGGGAAAGPDNGEFVNYSTVRADLIANAAPGDTSFNALPTGTTIQGQSQVAVWNAQLKLFGLISPNSTATDDGSATFATDINPNLLVGVALHELTHAIGRVPYGSQPDIFDFYRFTSPGTRLFTDNIPASSAYFSLDGGNTRLADFGVSSDPSDFLNAPNSNLTPTDAFDEFYSNNTLQSLTPVDLEMLDALGFNTTPLGLVVVANTAQALQGGSAVSLLSSAPNINDPGSTTLSSATVKIADAGGNAVAGDKLFVNGIENGSLGNGVTASWNATTDTLTLSGTASVAVYDALLSEITFQDTGTDASSGSHPVRTVTWTINDGTNSYNATSTIDVDRAPVAANNSATDAVGTTLSTTAANGVLANASDLDGDSLAVTAVSDTAHGAGTVGSSLAGLYGHLTLNANGSYSYVADNSAAISSAPTGSHLQDVFTYTVSDGNGGTTNASLTVTLDRLPVVTASNVTLSAGHTSVAASSLFSATDPDGNTITTYAFEDTGSGHFVLNGIVEPNNQEIDLAAAQLSQLTYQGVAGSTTDTVEIRVNDGTLWSNWTSFTVTPPPVVIQTDGTTALTEVGNNYYLYTNGSGPSLKFGGSPVTTGEFGTWNMIGAVAITGGNGSIAGYDVAWHDSSSGLYVVWDTDSNGNYLSNLVSSVPGNNASLESLETTFNQDLNGDGTIGLPKVVIQTDGTTALTEIGNAYYLYTNGLGPSLKFGGSPVTTGEFGTWNMIGAVAITGGNGSIAGYDVAWHDSSSGLYVVWDTDSNGNYLSNLIPAVPGNSSALESLETTFNQDLNGDGTIGIYVAPGTTLQVTSPFPSAMGAATIGAGATIEVGTADSASMTFSSSTGMLKLDSLTAFTGVIDNFTGNGSLSGSDQIDLKGINFNSVHDSYSNGILTVTDGTNTTTLDFNGTYVLANFEFASDGSGGTIVYDPPVPAQPQSPSAVGHTASSNAAGFFTGAGQDSFVFAPALGHNSATGWNPTMDAGQNSPAASWNVAAFLPDTHDGTHGHAFMTDSAHHAMPAQPLTEAQFHAHLSDFHIV